MQPYCMATTSNIEILEHFQLKALCVIVASPWYMPNMVIQRDLQTPTVKEKICRYNSQYTTHRLSSELRGATRQQQAIVKTPSKWSVYYIHSVIVVFVVLIFKV
jgi:4-amino-4-deoxy-L-arabinose transferase-like glycosyltransferase